MTTTTIKRGDIFWVDLSGARGAETDTKIRPALIVQNNIGNQYSPTTIVAPVTSIKAHSKVYPFEVRVTPQESGLQTTSKILLNQIRTVGKTRLTTRVGQLSPTKMLEVEKAIKISLAL